MRNTFGNACCSGQLWYLPFRQHQAKVVCIPGGPVEVTKSRDGEAVCGLVSYWSIRRVSGVSSAEGSPDTPNAEGVDSPTQYWWSRWYVPGLYEYLYILYKSSTVCTAAAAAVWRHYCYGYNSSSNSRSNKLDWSNENFPLKASFQLVLGLVFLIR